MGKTKSHHSTGAATPAGSNRAKRRAVKARGLDLALSGGPFLAALAGRLLAATQQEYAAAAAYLPKQGPLMVQGLPLLRGTQVAVAVHEGDLRVFIEKTEKPEEPLGFAAFVQVWEEFILAQGESIDSDQQATVIFVGRWSEPEHDRAGIFMIYQLFHLHDGRLTTVPIRGNKLPFAGGLRLHVSEFNLDRVDDALDNAKLAAETAQAVIRANTDNPVSNGNHLFEGMVWYGTPPGTQTSAQYFLTLWRHNA